MLKLTLLFSYPENLPKPFIVFLNRDMTEEIASADGCRQKQEEQCIVRHYEETNMQMLPCKARLFIYNHVHHGLN